MLQPGGSYCLTSSGNRRRKDKMAEFRKKAPPKPAADSASKAGLQETLGGSNNRGSKGFGPDGKAHVSRESGGDSTFILSPTPEDTSGEAVDSVYEVRGAQGLGLPGRSLNARQRVRELHPQGDSA